MKLSDLFVVEAPTRFRKTWKAHFFGTRIEATATDRDAAIDGVISQIRRNDQNASQHVYRFATNGTLFHLYWQYDAWWYDIVTPARGERNQTLSSCGLSTRNFSEALAQMESHVAQYGD